MSKVYLAARYSRHPEMRSVRDWLERRGFTVTSRWIDLHGGQHETSFSADALNSDPESCAKIALDDLDDLREADVVISFTGGGGKGGRHAEFGAAAEAGKRLIVVGPREHVFHTLPQVEHFPDWPAARAALEPLVAVCQWERTAALEPTPAEWNAMVQERDSLQGQLRHVCERLDRIRYAAKAGPDIHVDDLIEAVHDRVRERDLYKGNWERAQQANTTLLASLGRPAAQEAGSVAEWLRGPVLLCLSCGLDETTPSPQCAEHPTKATAHADDCQGCEHMPGIVHCAAQEAPDPSEPSPAWLSGWESALVEVDQWAQRQVERAQEDGDGAGEQAFQWCSTFALAARKDPTAPGRLADRVDLQPAAAQVAWAKDLTPFVPVPVPQRTETPA